MKVRTYTVSNKPYVFYGLFDCLSPRPLSISQTIVANTTCTPGNLPYNFYPQQFALGLLANANNTITFPFCGRFKVWCGMIYDAPLAALLGLGDNMTLLNTGTLPKLTFGLLNNLLVQEIIRPTPYYWSLNAFTNDCVTSDETFQADITEMAQNQRCVVNTVFAPATFDGPSPKASVTFFESPQDSFFTYRNNTFPWYGDCPLNSHDIHYASRFNKIKMCVVSIHGGSGNFKTSTFSAVLGCKCHEFDGVFNSMTIDRGAIRFWLGGSITTVTPNDPCGNSLGPFTSYQSGITLNPHYGVLVFRFEAYPLEI